METVFLELDIFGGLTKPPVLHHPAQSPPGDIFASVGLKLAQERSALDHTVSGLHDSTSALRFYQQLLDPRVRAQAVNLELESFRRPTIRYRNARDTATRLHIEAFEL